MNNWAAEQNLLDDTSLVKLIPGTTQVQSRISQPGPYDDDRAQDDEETKKSYYTPLTPKLPAIHADTHKERSDQIIEMMDQDVDFSRTLVEQNQVQSTIPFSPTPDLRENRGGRKLTMTRSRTVVEKDRKSLVDPTSILNMNKELLDIPQIKIKVDKPKDKGKLYKQLTQSNFKAQNQGLEQDHEKSDSEIKKIHDANNLMKSQSSQNFIGHMIHAIPLFSEMKDVKVEPDVESEFEEASNDGRPMNTISRSKNQSQGLYNIIGALVTNNKQKFCPILLEITNQELLETKFQAPQGYVQDQLLPNEEPKNYRFLLQVWTQNGVLIYERRMNDTIRGWYMDDEDEVLLFEFNLPDEVQQYTIYALHCKTDSPARLITINIPKISSNRYRETTDGKDIIKKEDGRKLPSGIILGDFELDEHSKTEDVKQKMQELGETEPIASKTPINVSETKDLKENKIAPNKSQEASKQIGADLDPALFKKYQKQLNEENLPQQIKMNMSMLGGANSQYLLRASDEVIYVIDLKNFSEILKQDAQQTEDSNAIEIAEKQIYSIKLHPGFRFIDFIDIGKGKEAMLLENKTSNELRFFTLVIQDDKIHFIQLGIHQDMCDMKESNVVKHVSVFIDEEKDILEKLQGDFKKKLGLGEQDEYQNKESQVESHHVTLMLRKNGRVEVYSDFVFTHAFDMSSQGLFCVDIDQDHDFLYLKYLNLHYQDENELLEEKGKQSKSKIPQKKFIIRKVSVKWRTRIKYNYTEEVKHDEWTTVANSKFSSYFKLYTKFVNMSIYYLVAHRNFISVYDMSESKWIRHLAVDSNEYIRDIVLQKRVHDSNFQQTKDEAKQRKFHAQKNPSFFDSYHLVVFFGTNSVQLIDVKKDGKLKLRGLEQIKGTIISIQDDEKENTGCLLLVSEKQDIANSNQQLLQSDETKENIIHQFVIENQAKEVDKAFSGQFKLKHYNYSEHYYLHPEKEYFPNVQSDSEFFIINMHKDFLLTWLQDFTNQEKMMSESVDRQTELRDMQIAERQYVEKQLKKNNEDGIIKFLVVKTGKEEKIQLEKETGERESKVMRAVTPEIASEIKKGTQIKTKMLLYPYLKKMLSHEYQVVKGFSIDTLENEEEEYKKVFPKGTERILSFSMLTDEENEKQRGYSVIVTRDNLCVLNDKFEVQYRFTGLNITAAIQIKDYLYTINEIGSTVKKKDYSEEFEDLEDEELPIDEEKTFSAINLKQLLKGDLKKIEIMTVTSGSCSRIEDSLMSHTLAFMPSFSTLITMPIPHLNILSMVGMETKHEYLIWRKTRNGFFTALDKDGDMRTWSCSNGKMLYINSLGRQTRSEKNVENFDLAISSMSRNGKVRRRSLIEKDDVPWVEINKETLRNYRVYRSDKNDLLYTRDQYEKEDCTYQLLVSKDPVDKEKCKELYKNEFDRQEKQIAKQDIQRKGSQSEISTDGIAIDKLFVFPEPEGQQQQRFAVKQNTKNFDLFHFQVLKMQTFCDTQSKPNCSVYFHFFHYLFANTKENYIYGQWSFDKNVQQRLILSQNTERLMEIVNGCRIAICYERQKKQLDHDRNNLVSWKEKFFIPNFPYLALTVTSLPSMLSPNFDQMLDFNYQNKSLRIVDTETRKIEGEVPSDLLTVRQLGNEVESIREVFAKVAFSYKQGVIKIFNDKTKKIIKYDYEPVDNFKLKFRSYWQLSGAEQQWNGKNHMFFQKQPFAQVDVLKRLMRKNVNYRNHMNSVMYRYEDIKNSRDEFDKEENVKLLYNYMTAIDYSQDWGSDTSNFDSELTFTIVDWCLSQEIKNTSFSFKQLMPDEQKRLLYCIFGHGETFLQMLAQDDLDDQNTKKNSLEDCKKIFEAAASWNKDSQTLFQVPILQDVYGLTPLDYALGIQDHVQEVQYFKPFSLDDHMTKDQVTKTQNLQIAEVIFDGIKNYKLNSISPAMVPAIIEGVKKEIPSVFTFLDSRLIKGDYISVNTQPPVKEKYFIKNKIIGDYGAKVIKAFKSEKAIEEQMFTAEGLAEPRQCFYLDLPLIYDAHSKFGISFIAALCKQSDKKTFYHESIQIIVGEHWKQWYWFNYYHRGFPLMLLIILFTIWSNVMLVNQERVDSGFMTFWEIMILFISSYFISLTVVNQMKMKIQYPHVFDDVKVGSRLSQTTMVISPIFVCFTICYSWYLGRDQLNEQFWQVNGFAAIFIWFRLLIFLQSNERMSFIVSMVMTCFKTMSAFLALLFIGVLAFANAILSVRQSLKIKEGLIDDVEEDPQSFKEELMLWLGKWITSVKSVYYWSLGEFDSNEADTFQFGSFLIFLILTIFNIVILINLLIALVNEIFNEVSALKNETMIKRRCEQISYCQMAQFKKKDGDVNKLLFVVKNEKSLFQGYDQNKALIDIKNRTLQIQKELTEIQSAQEQNENFQIKVMERLDKIQSLLSKSQSGQKNSKLSSTLTNQSKA